MLQAKSADSGKITDDEAVVSNEKQTSQRIVSKLNGSGSNAVIVVD